MDATREYISKLREDFTKGELSEKDVTTNPFIQFEKWMKEAVESQIPEVQAMTLSTVDTEGLPNSRIVYLREYDAHQFTFYTNYNSRKSEQLSYNPYGACLFFWPDLERQIHLKGKIVKASDAVSDAYFNLRPRDSKISAWASPQSQVIDNREVLTNKIAELEETFKDKEIPRPPFWGGFHLQATYYEFWQGRKNRRHDRIAYQLSDSGVWQMMRLAP
ncbi:MAG: pyridoxamine 5'-phosphate oxidase [Sediminibacterium sp.]|nr:pyridoxamine 5'-phosphate oxidase [Sediminibacterium sp.]